MLLGLAGQLHSHFNIRIISQKDLIGMQQKI